MAADAKRVVVVTVLMVVSSSDWILERGSQTKKLHGSSQLLPNAEMATPRARPRRTDYRKIRR
jgi:hypothetical protein